ncbi:unnamed protein product [Adineta steineri]|uniref:Caspase family p20 domain-containing protein n=1 Tax=Adineta steineri TaxID=433720 RepID=A0A819R2I9_9BILA|nr:unnamed protein product [Adineta steineri]
MCAFRNGSQSNIRASSSTHRKLALVFGNRLYQHNASLRNSENDANDITRSLESIGFQVTKGLNLACEEMDSYVTNFVRNIQSSDVILFYFSGHGTQWEDQNYLVPSDDNNLNSSNIKRHALNAQDVLDRITRRNPYVSIFILDCCRNYYLRNPELLRGNDSNTKGLKPMYASAGSLIAFACAPGATASDGSDRNGLFTKHLLQNITKPNEQIQDLLIDVTKGVATESYNKQIPWYHSSLMDRNIMLSSNGNDNSGFNSESGEWHQEFHGQSHDGRHGSLIKKAEKALHMDLDGDGRIG